jgi:adenylate cyclase
VAAELALRTVARLRVKGKAQAVEVFELVGENAALDPPGREFLAAFGSGYDSYCAQRFAEAAQAFAMAARLRPDDFLAQRYLAESRSLAANSPASDWEPILQLHTK